MPFLKLFHKVLQRRWIILSILLKKASDKAAQFCVVSLNQALANIQMWLKVPYDKPSLLCLVVQVTMDNSHSSGTLTTGVVECKGLELLPGNDTFNFKTKSSPLS